MLWRRTKPLSTRDLLRSDHRLLAQGRRARNFWPLVCLALVVAAGLPSVWLYQQHEGQQMQRAALEAEVESLRSQLQAHELQARMSEATEQQLTRRNADLSAQIERLTTELAFFRQQKSKR
ncbi:hypothetical protein [Pseudomonas sp. Marseille-QA0892]